MRYAAFLLSLLVGLSACATNDVARQQSALTLSGNNLSERQIESRRYDTTDEASILSATIGIMQDLGFTIEESAAKSGLVTGSQDSAGQRVRLSIITTLSADKKAVTVRANFQRIGWDGRNGPMRDPILYQRFFDKLSQAIFLEAHEI